MLIPILLILTSAALAVLSMLQLHERGPLLNNAYLFASEQERQTMDKSPHYRQSGICFALLALIFLVLVLDMLFFISWLNYLFWALVVLTLCYALVSTIKR